MREGPSRDGIDPIATKPRSAIPASVTRKIIHVDMDAFFASVEQRDDPDPARAAGSGRLGDRARRGGGGELRGAHVRGAFGDALGRGAAALSRPGVRPAPVRRLQGGVGADPRDLPRLHAAGRAAVAGRGVSRRERELARTALCDRDRGGNPRADPGRDATDRVGGDQLQQAARETGVGSEQARRAMRDHAGARRGVRREPADRAVSRDRAAAPRRRCSGWGSRPAPTCASASCRS